VHAEAKDSRRKWMWGLLALILISQFLRDSGNAGSVRSLHIVFCNAGLGGHEPLYVSELLGTRRGAPYRYPAAGHEHGISQPRESGTYIRRVEFVFLGLSPDDRLPTF